ncbi:L,D-transpeptidase family protein [Sneathiella sp. DP05]|uniref:L,D-transpeptidase family protein n=1 Tax=Sneathiella litorea TaxID=2606216 RepID=A0A6L8W9U8_9PROT|nr:L,D-transpeptidase family protein [Sneathiella litorea]
MIHGNRKKGSISWTNSLAAVAVTLLTWTAAQAEEIIGTEKIYTAEKLRTLSSIAVASGIGYVELRSVNPATDPWDVKPNEKLLIPDRHILPRNLQPGFTVNIGDMRLYYKGKTEGEIRSWPIGIGREGRRTPVGAMTVTELRENPTWRPTRRMRELDPDLPAAVPPGPNNPLGKYAVRIGWDGYVLHGTNKEPGVGRRVSSGCVRLYDKAIEEVFNLAKVGMPVTLIDEPLKVGWDGKAVYLEAHPTGPQADQIELTGKFDPSPADLSEIQRTAVAKAEAHGLSRIDWAAFDRIIQERRGLPEKIAE